MKLIVIYVESSFQVSLPDIKVIWNSYLLIIKFMSGCLYFLNYLEDIKDHI